MYMYGFHVLCFVGLHPAFILRKGPNCYRDVGNVVHTVNARIYCGTRTTHDVTYYTRRMIHAT